MIVVLSLAVQVKRHDHIKLCMFVLTHSGVICVYLWLTKHKHC